MITAKYREFLDLIDAAVELGLEVNMKGDLPDISVSRINNEHNVYAKEYQVVSWATANQGHTMVSVYTRTGAERIKALIDEYISDPNPTRETKIDTTYTFYSAADLMNFIELRKREDSNATTINSTPAGGVRRKQSQRVLGKRKGSE